MREKVMPVQVYSRVCGFFRPTDHYNPGKLAEFNERKTYDVNKKFVESLNN